MEISNPNRPSRCTWRPRDPPDTGTSADNPHTRRDTFPDRKTILPDVLHAIGQTPMVRLNKIPQSLGIKCEIFAKCEFFNPGGSVKDRIGYRMVQDAEDKGYLKPGYTIIEPTSGNTGIGLAMAAAVKGYRCIIVMPEKMSNEKVYTLQSLGAEIIRTPTEAAWDSPESHVSVAQKLQREIPNSVILDQYTNPGNPLAHYDQTAKEIWEQCEGKVDYIVAGAGTGGTIAGIGRRFKEISPKTKIIAIDPEGSMLAEPPEVNETAVQSYEVEGIGYDFIPTVLDRSVVDIWVKTNDADSFKIARKLIKEEGLLCGGSSGSAVAAALKIAKDIPEGKRLVVVLPDGIRNYLTKFVSDLWMESKSFLEPPKPVKSNEWWWDIPVSKMTYKKVEVIPESTTCGEAVAHMQKKGFHQIPVNCENGQIRGVITLNKLLSMLIAGDIIKSDSVVKALVKDYRKVATCTKLGRLSRMLEKDIFAVVLDEKSITITGIITQIDLLNFICNGSKNIIDNNINHNHTNNHSI